MSNGSEDRSANAPVQLPQSSKLDVVHCGRGGECGHLCLIAAMACERNLPWDAVKSELGSRAKTTETLNPKPYTQNQDMRPHTSAHTCCGVPCRAFHQGLRS